MSSLTSEPSSNNTTNVASAIKTQNIDLLNKKESNNVIPDIQESIVNDVKEPIILTKTQLKKRKKLEERRLKYIDNKKVKKEKKKLKKGEQKEKITLLTSEGKLDQVEEYKKSLYIDKTNVQGRGNKALIKERLMNASINAPKVVIDCSFNDIMITKDLTSLITQVRVCYSLNRRKETPLDLIVSSAEESMLKRMDPNYKNWNITFEPQNFADAYKDNIKNIVYLTAESENILNELESSKLYIIGGLVDHNKFKGKCHGDAIEKGYATARLPILEHMRSDHMTRRVLTVNQVFQIMLEFYCTKSWPEALEKSMPSRKGFVLAEEEKKEDILDNNKILNDEIL